MSYEEQLHDELRLVRKLLNVCYNELCLADTDDKYHSLLQEIAYLEERHERLNEEIDDMVITMANKF